MTLLVTAVLFIMGMSITVAVCAPRSQGLSLGFIETCSRMSSTMGVFLGTVAVVMDLIILILPIPVVLALQLPLRKKLSLVLLFLSGIL